jgi:superfamily II DNA or RNA helicase
MKTREIIQHEALEALKKNNYTGSVCISTGAGKSKILVDAIKQGSFKRILITSPRTNLKENWKQELSKWGIMETVVLGLYHYGYNKMSYSPQITIENIQTVYKWNKEKLLQFDLIGCDEIHFHSQEYSTYIEVARDNGIPVIGLTATPTKNDPFKKEVLYSLVPIVYEYYNSEQDGIINKVNYYVWEYELTDDYKVLTGNKHKKWMVGEKKQYEYLTEQYEKAKRGMFLLGANDYFSTSLVWMKLGDKEQRSTAVKFFYAVKNRKDFLWNLNSSAVKAISLKLTLFKHNPDNKVLLFSELTGKADKLSKYALHSNTGKTAKETKEYNKVLLEQFNDGTIKELSSCLSLTLGLNMKGVNWAIFESYSSSETNSRQKKGRLNRLNINEMANIVIIKPINTQAETWFDGAFSWIDDYTVINELNELQL